MSPLISTKNLTKIYGEPPSETVALHNISFELKRGEFVSIVGPSGSGKSTLLHLIGLLDKSTTGEIFFEGTNIKKLTDSQLAKLRNGKIGFVFQTFNLLARTTALENVILPLQYSNIKANQEELAKNLLKKVGLEKRVQNLSNQLSGGEQQRVAIARALICNPLLILADEPTGNLDTKTGAQILAILAQLNKEGRTVVVVTHDAGIAKLAKRIVKLADGQIVVDWKKK